MAGHWRSAAADVPTCEHALSAPVVIEAAEACEDCVAAGTRWVHLRRCLACQHVGCCDSSPERHASRHWQTSRHPVAASAEPGEHWGWCFPDRGMLVPAR